MITVSDKRWKKAKIREALAQRVLRHVRSTQLIRKSGGGGGAEGSAMIEKVIQ